MDFSDNSVTWQKACETNKQARVSSCFFFLPSFFQVDDGLYLQVEFVYSVELGGEARHRAIEMFADLLHLYQEAIRLDRPHRALHHHPLFQHLIPPMSPRETSVNHQRGTSKNKKRVV